MTGQDVHHHAQREAPGVPSGQEGPHFPFGDLAVAHGGDSGSQERLLSVVQHAGQVVRVVRQVEVGAVVSEFDPVGSGEQVAGGVEYSTGGPSVLVTVDDATGRGGRRRGYTGLGQPMAVYRESVAADVHHGDRPVVSYPVQLQGRGVPTLG